MLSSQSFKPFSPIVADANDGDLSLVQAQFGPVQHQPTHRDALNQYGFQRSWVSTRPLCPQQPKFVSEPHPWPAWLEHQG